jgi:hypothetical protein
VRIQLLLYIFPQLTALHSPTVHLHIGASTPPAYMSTRQSLLTSASKALHRHLRAQVPNARDYASRDKTMKMRNEAPSTVARFLSFLETGSYHHQQQQLDDSLCTHLRMLVFAGKYEVPRLAVYARRRAGKVLERMLAGAEEEEERNVPIWNWVCGKVLEQVQEEAEKRVLREVLGRLVAPYVWRASGEEW